MADEKTRDRINHLYWDSDASVGEIAERVGVSRRALYDAIEYRPVDRPCPDCGAGLGYRNRTAAENREVECPDCGFTTTLTWEPGPQVGQGIGGDGSGDQEEPEVEQEETAGPKAPVRHLPPPHGNPAVGAALLVGLAAGAMTGYLLRRR